MYESNYVSDCRQLKLVAISSPWWKKRKNKYFKHEKETHCIFSIVEKECVRFKVVINIDIKSKLYNYM